MDRGISGTGVGNIASVRLAEEHSIRLQKNCCGNMPKRVTFNPRVKVRQNNLDMSSVALNADVERTSVQSTPDAMANQAANQLKKSKLSSGSGPGGSFEAGIAGVIVILVCGLAVLATWIAGLVKMGMCGGVSAVYFWATLLLFILLPGPGTVAGFIMAIVALAMLKPGKTALGMTCANNK